MAPTPLPDGEDLLDLIRKGSLSGDDDEDLGEEVSEAVSVARPSATQP